MVIVTGATRGIGRATATQLAARGAIVVCVGRASEQLQQVAAELAGSFIVADLAEPAAAERIVAEAIAQHGRLDIIVANAGVGYAGEFAHMPAERIIELIDVNVRAPMLLARAGIAALRESDAPIRGIVFVSSIAGAVGVPGESVYSASKAAIESFATVLREEVRADGISVSTVLPGVVATEFHDRRQVAYERRYPRPMPAERVANVIVATLEDRHDRRVEPRWLAFPARFAATAPGLYRRLARRFG